MGLILIRAVSGSMEVYYPQKELAEALAMKLYLLGSVVSAAFSILVPLRELSFGNCRHDHF